MSEAMEFSIITDLTPLRNFDIQANFNECKKWLDENLAPYRTMVVTEDGIASAKAYRASIRKVSARIDECRKMAKEAAMQSYRPFEEKCKGLMAMCEESAANLDDQIKAFDEAKKAEKQDRLRRFYSESIGEMNDYLTFEAIFNSRWLNATYAEEQARKDIIVEIAKCDSSVQSLRSLRSPFETELLAEFRQNHDLAACLKKNDGLLRLKEIEDRRKMEREEEARRNAEQAAAVAKASQERTECVAKAAVTAAQNIVVGERTQQVQEAAEKKPPKRYTVAFRVSGTKEQLDVLRQYMIDNGIEFGPVQ